MAELSMARPTQCHLWQNENVRPEDLRDALQVIETWTDESHLSKHLCRCKGCGQLYVDVWYELIDWDDGDDQTQTLYIPVASEAQIALVKDALPPPLSLDLLGFHPRITELWRDGARKFAWIGKT